MRGNRDRQGRVRDGDYALFRQRLERNLSELGLLLNRPGFGTGPPTIGAELELFLVDREAQPLPLNQAVCAEAADPRITVELDRFNLELEPPAGAARRATRSPSSPASSARCSRGRVRRAGPTGAR